jgi:hypothetical protein
VVMFGTTNKTQTNHWKCPCLVWVLFSVMCDMWHVTNQTQPHESWLSCGLVWHNKQDTNKLLEMFLGCLSESCLVWCVTCDKPNTIIQELALRWLPLCFPHPSQSNMPCLVTYKQVRPLHTCMALNRISGSLPWCPNQEGGSNWSKVLCAHFVDMLMTCINVNWCVLTCQWVYCCVLTCYSHVLMSQWLSLPGKSMG